MQTKFPSDYKDKTIFVTSRTWSFLDKWHTYDNEDGSPSNDVVCPQCAPIFENDPSLRPLENQIPDPTLKCALCDKEWI